MTNRKQSSRESQKQFSAYAKYSSLAIQMMLMIGIGTYGGFRVDKYLGWKFPVLTIVLSLLSVGFSIWYAVKDLLKK